MKLSIVNFVEKGDKYVSPFHDVPLYANAEKTVYNAIMEVPRWSNAKMEVSAVNNTQRRYDRCGASQEISL